MAQSRKPYNPGYKVLKMDKAAPFSKVGEKPSNPGKQAKSMLKTALGHSPEGKAKLRQSSVP